MTDLVSPFSSPIKGVLLSPIDSRSSRDFSTLNVLFTGQSLFRRAIDTHGGDTDFETAATGLGYTTVNAINGAQDSAAVHFDAISTAGSYVASDDTSRGTSYTNMQTAVTNSGIDPSDIHFVFIWIGNTDRVAIMNELNTPGTGITEAEHKSAMETYISFLKSDYPNATIVIYPNIGNNGVNTANGHVAWTAVKRAQEEIRNADASLPIAPGTFHIDRSDAQHLSDSGTAEAMQMAARLCAHIDGVGSPNNPLGPQITDASYNATADSITVNIAHDDGTDFTMTDPHRFNIVEGSNVYVPDTIVKNSATQFTLSGGDVALTAGDTVTLEWPGGTSFDMTIANILKDNATNSLPLRPKFGLNVTDATPAGFSPDDLDELKGWFDFSDTSTITTSGSEATAITDKSGGTNAARIGTGADSGTATINSLNGLEFAKGEAYSMSISATNGVTGFLVLQFVTDTTTVNFIRDSDNANSIRMYTNSSSVLVLDLQNYNLTGSTAVSASTTYIISFEVDSSGATLRLNGVQEATSASDPGFTSAWDVFGGTSFGYEGIMGEILGFDNTLTTSEMNQVGNYLADKWGGTWTDIT